MEVWEAILTAAGTCLATLIVTTLFNWLLNRPKKKREYFEDKFADIDKKIDTKFSSVETMVDTKMDSVRTELLNKLDTVEKQSEKRQAEYEAYTQDMRQQLNEMHELDKAHNVGLQEVLKDMLDREYNHHISEGYATTETKEKLERTYSAYHKLGANGVMDSLRKQFLNLPTKKQQ